MSPLESILNLFASHEHASWNLFLGLPMVEWHDLQASAIEFENPAELTANNSHVRNGHLLLLGFDGVDMPDALPGCEAGVVHRNEGYSSLALIGDANSVHWIIVQKFYPSHRLQELIDAQWPRGESADPPVLQRSPSSHHASTKNSVTGRWELVFKHQPNLYLDFFIDELGSRYSPGSSTLVFHKLKLTKA